MGFRFFCLAFLLAGLFVSPAQASVCNPKFFNSFFLLLHNPVKNTLQIQGFGKTPFVGYQETSKPYGTVEIPGQETCGHDELKIEISGLLDFDGGPGRVELSLFEGNTQISAYAMPWYIRKKDIIAEDWDHDEGLLPAKKKTLSFNMPELVWGEELGLFPRGFFMHWCKDPFESAPVSYGNCSSDIYNTDHGLGAPYPGRQGWVQYYHAAIVPVPLPAMGGAFGAALGGLWFARRRRRTQPRG